MKRKTISAVALATATLLLFAAGCGSAEPSVDENKASTPVEVQTVARDDLSTENQVTGRVVSGNEVNVFPMLTAEYTEVLVSVGDAVEEGDVLARLDVATYSDNLADLRASYSSTSSTYESMKLMYDDQIAMAEKTLSDTQALFEIGAASALAVSQAELQLTSTRASAESALSQYKTSLDTLSTNIATMQANVDKGTITSPIAGTVTAVNAKVGTFASASMPAATVSEDGFLQVEAAVSEALAPKISVGDTVDVTIAALGSEVIEGVISQADPAANAASALYNVTIDLPLDCGASSGMSANLIFYTDTVRDTVVIPTEAILTSGEDQYVFTVDEDNIAHRITVQTGLIGSGTTQILSGLSGGETLVVSGQSYLEDGAAVRIVE